MKTTTTSPSVRICNGKKKRLPTPPSPGLYVTATEIGEVMVNGDYPSRAVARRATIEAAAGQAYYWHQVPPKC
jgi:hypothetical protein